MIRIVATDLDYTLLGEQWEISAKNKQAIRQAVLQGVKVILATGRMAVSARKYARELELDLPVIAYHGALVQQALSGEIIYRKVIPTASAAEIVNLLESSGVFYQIYLKDRVFAPRLHEYSGYYTKMSGVTVEIGIEQALAAESEGLEKILCFGEEERLRVIWQELDSAFGSLIHVTSSKYNNLEIVAQGVNKGSALRALAEGWGIRAEEIMAIGDSLNDQEMIAYAGIGVAVANAHPEIRRIADYIAASYDQDGVAEAIEKFVL